MGMKHWELTKLLVDSGLDKAGKMPDEEKYR